MVVQDPSPPVEVRSTLMQTRARHRLLLISPAPLLATSNTWYCTGRHSRPSRGFKARLQRHRTRCKPRFIAAPVPQGDPRSVQICGVFLADARRPRRSAANLWHGATGRVAGALPRASPDIALSQKRKRDHWLRRPVGGRALPCSADRCAFACHSAPPAGCPPARSSQLSSAQLSSSQLAVQQLAAQQLAAQQRAARSSAAQQRAAHQISGSQLSSAQLTSSAARSSQLASSAAHSSQL